MQSKSLAQKRFLQIQNFWRSQDDVYLLSSFHFETVAHSILDCCGSCFPCCSEGLSIFLLAVASERLTVFSKLLGQVYFSSRNM
jgi:hypothetical protein